MQNETVSRRYAAAIFALGKERGALEPVGRDLHAALDAIGKDDDARRFFTSPVVDRAQKSDVFAKAFAGFNEIALHAVLLLIRKRREGLLAPIVSEYDKLLLADADRERLEVTSARGLPKSELDKLVARLSRLYNKTFDVRQTVDPRLLSGIRISMGDRSIDGSIAGRLDEFARDLFIRK